MDVIAMHNAGFKNVVACMGTALTKYHAKELKRFTDKILVSFDGDAAGQKATLRSLEILEEEQLKVYVVSIPEKLDPDEFIKKYGANKFSTLLQNAMPLNDYKLKAIAGEFNLNDNIEKSKFIGKALEEIAKLHSSSEREIYLKQLSAKTKVDVNRLENDLKLLLRKKNREPQQVVVDETEQIAKDASYKSAEFILASILHQKHYVTPVNKDIFTNEAHKKLYDFICSSQNLQKQVKVGDLFTHFNMEEEPEIKDIINYSFAADEGKLEKYFTESVKTLELDELLQKQNSLIEQIKQENNKETKQKLMDEFATVSKQIYNTKLK
jgi:DNA primase